MKLTEFEDLKKAINFHDELNPRLWDGDKLQPHVRLALLRIAKNFKDFLRVDSYDLVDVTISGSNAAFTYTPHSDIDLHLIVMIPDDMEDTMKELFTSKKYQYNNQHDIKIRGYEVEVYVQDAEETHTSMGIYSVMRDKWISKPRRIRAQVDDVEVSEKYKAVKHRINKAIVSDDYDLVHKVWDYIKNMRKTGLESGGEFSPENLAFKILRADGSLDRIRKHLGQLEDDDLGLLEESVDYPSDWSKPQLKDFVKYVFKKLHIDSPIPVIKYNENKEDGQHHTGQYDMDKNQIEIYVGNRNLIDIMRTVAHELAHYKQRESSGMDGDLSDIEGQADMAAGMLIKLYGRKNPEILQ